MANTSTQLDIEKHIQKWLREQFGQNFSKKNLSLTSGGQFEFDAVSEDGEIVATISTSSARTASGNRGTGKLQKIRADALFLCLSKAEQRVLVFTEEGMSDLCKKEQVRGRLPQNLLILLAPLPSHLKTRLRHARSVASMEVTPSHRT